MENPQMEELFEVADVVGGGGGRVETGRVVEKIGMRVYITDLNAIEDFVPATLPPGYSGYGWVAAAFSCKTSMYSLLLRIENILWNASKHRQGRTAHALRGASDDQVEEGTLDRVKIIITDNDELHGWYSAQTCQATTLMVILHRVNDVAYDESESPPPCAERPWLPIDPVQVTPRSLKKSWTSLSQIRKSKIPGHLELASRN